MKNLFLIFVFLTTILSCSFRTDNSNSSGQNITKESFITQTNTSENKINTTLPFGCLNLTKYKYPKHWDGDLENYGQLKQPKGLEFKDIGTCFDAINSAKTIKPPRPQRLELLEIGGIFKNANNLDTLMQISIDSCRYRLPNIGIYECYYSYQRYGNLILLDPKTNEGKLLNIYADDLGGEAHTILRYFFIDKNGVNIYEAYYYDDGCSLDETFKVIVNTDGEIKINQINK
jgi:hypothetical protein